MKHEIRCKESCEGELTFTECGAALKQMQNNKSPGSDGYTSDFYKFFWKDVGPFVFRSLNFGYKEGKFSDFQLQGVITCIPKENKDRRYMSNWRPISLLNTDLKIASAAIANRIKKVLPEIISDTQKGFIKGRFIGENTRLLYDLMHYLEENNLDGLLLMIDFEKAFDSIEWSFLINSLKSFNFGSSVCKWFSVFYNNAKSCVINNGFMSSFFNLERGCRQGDPLSPYLFIIGVELVSLKIKSNSNIKGIIVNNTESLISQYADDTFLVLDGSERSLQESLGCFEKFNQISGLKMNPSKTSAVWIGSKRFSDLILCPEKNLHWSHTNFRLLGIEFSLDLSSMVDLNFQKKIKEVTKLLKSWQHRKLSLLGKITVIKSLALSKFVHLLTSLPNLKTSSLNYLNKIFYNFIWDGKPDKIKRKILIGDYLEGGLKMVHLESFSSYLKVGWVKKFLGNLSGNWQSVIGVELERYGGERVFSLHREKMKITAEKISNPFWKDVLFSMYLAKPDTKQTMQDILSLDILNFVDIEDFPFFKRWNTFGIKNLCDLINTEKTDFVPFEYIRKNCNTSNFVKYFSLLSNIPLEFKQYIKNNLDKFDVQGFMPTDSFIDKILSNKSLKFVYNYIVHSVAVQPVTKILAWEQLFDCEIDNWASYFDITKRACRDSYLRNFQYKFLHRIIPTNTFLYKIHLTESKVCTFCKNYDETVGHLFFDCPITSTFWYQFFEYLRIHFTHIEVEKRHILLGFLEESLLLNLLIIIAKNYIFKCKLDKKLPNIPEVKNKVRKYMSVELYIGSLSNTPEKAENFGPPSRKFFP